MKRSKKDDNMGKFLINCLKCCLGCAERFVKFFNKHAYTEVMLNSTNFCSSAKSALSLIARNSIRFTVLHGLGAVVMLFARVFIICLCMGISYFTLTNGYQLGPEEGKVDLKAIIAPLSVRKLFF